METSGTAGSGLHAIIDSPLAWASCPVCLLQAALAAARAGGRRQAGERRKEPLSWPRRRRSGAAPCHR
eukprot:912251-Prymnesium_polylepis.1